VVVQPCGGLDSELAESLLFGHTKDAYTGAQTERKGALQNADGGILFLDEIQDLPRAVQRKLVRVFQDRKRRFQQLGNDTEFSVDVELVCASNQPIGKLRELLDPDLFDRVAQLIIEIPPLRDCREDIKADWQQVWLELRQQENLPKEAPSNADLFSALDQDRLSGNMRYLQRLAVLIIAWWEPANPNQAIDKALSEWRHSLAAHAPAEKHLGSGNRNERIQQFKTELAHWAKERFGTWKKAANALKCDDKTLREDAKEK
jgi:DNA-binding NtrC family response regulator